MVSSMIVIIASHLRRGEDGYEAISPAGTGRTLGQPQPVETAPPCAWWWWNQYQGIQVMTSLVPYSRFISWLNIFRHKNMQIFDRKNIHYINISGT